MDIRAGADYTVSVWAKSSSISSITLQLSNTQHSKIYASETWRGVKTEWNLFAATLQADST